MKNYRTVGNWRQTNLEVVEIIDPYTREAALYALYGWNGEAWCDCWQVAQSNNGYFSEIANNKTFTIRPDKYKYKYKQIDDVLFETQEYIVTDNVLFEPQEYIVTQN